MNTKQLAALPNLDLSRVVPKVYKNNPTWDDERVAAAQKAYLEFLQLCKTYPDRKISAPADVDEFWHEHMLDSVNYHKDCENYFGYYLHHDPCLGETDLKGAQDTLSLYQTTFGLDVPLAWKGLVTCANPGDGCGSIMMAAR